MEKIKLTGSASDQPAAPAGAEQPNSVPPVISQDSVTVEQALGGVEHTKIATVTGVVGGPVQSVNPGSSVPVAGLVDAKLAVEIMDATLPALMVFLLYKIGMKLRKTDLQLTEKEKNTLAPVVQKCLEQLMINFNNPWVALSVTVLTIYGSKVIEKGLPQLWEKKQAKIEKDALETKAAAQGSTVAKEEVKTPPPAPPPYEPTEAEIKAKMKAHKYSWEKAREMLINLHIKAWKDQQRRAAVRK